jgi:Asp/Glu/hydantoin racemase
MLIGILSLDCEPFLVPGLLTCEKTFSFPRLSKVVKGATVQKATTHSEDLESAFVQAARELEQEGVAAIIGDCGFMALFQKVVQESVNIPVAMSSLLLVPLVARMSPHGKKVAILTFRADSLNESHFRACGWSSRDIPILVEGVEDQWAWAAISTPERPFHRPELEQQLLEVVRSMKRKHPDLGSIVLECTVMPPFAHEIQRELHVPVYDTTLLANFLVESLCRKPFGPSEEASVACLSLSKTQST